MKYVAFLRGVNVGGKNIIKMADLKQMFAILGINEVSTYIQSGNVIFSSDDNETFLVDKIEVGILQTFGFSASVILRTLDELREIVDNNPYLNGSRKTVCRKSIIFIYFCFPKYCLRTIWNTFPYIREQIIIVLLGEICMFYSIPVSVIRK